MPEKPVESCFVVLLHGVVMLRLFVVVTAWYVCTSVVQATTVIHKEGGV